MEAGGYGFAVLVLAAAVAGDQAECAAFVDAVGEALSERGDTT